MAYSLSSTFMCLLFLASLLCSFHACLASRLLPESKESLAKELGLDSSSLFQPSNQALPTFQNHMLIPNPNPALPTLQDHMPFPNPNPPLPTFKDNMPIPTNPVFRGLPGLPRLPPLPSLPPLPPIPPNPFFPPYYNPYIHAIPPIPGYAKKASDSAVSTDGAITATP